MLLLYTPLYYTIKYSSWLTIIVTTMSWSQKRIYTWETRLAHIQANGNQGSSLMRHNHILNSIFETFRDINVPPDATHKKYYFEIDDHVWLGFPYLNFETNPSNLNSLNS